MVQVRRGLRKIKTGGYSYTDAVKDVVRDIFNNDPAVASLYEFWGNPAETNFDKWTLRRSIDFVNQMQDSWYRTYFEQLMVVIKERLYLPNQTPLAKQGPIEKDPFALAFSQYMKHAVGIRNLDIDHVYARVRRDANSRVGTNYPPLKFNAVPEPEWFSDPVAPTHNDFISAYAVVIADTPL